MPDIPQTFRALILEERDGRVVPEIRALPASALPEGDVLVRVAYSDLNYKDGLAILNRNKVIRSFPMVPGIDFAGTVLESRSPSYSVGDRVLLTGWGVGERHWGGFAQLARVKSEWLVPVPAGVDLDEAVAVGTAGVPPRLPPLGRGNMGPAPPPPGGAGARGAGGAR